jgi:hypothetical protein
MIKIICYAYQKDYWTNLNIKIPVSLDLTGYKTLKLS